MRPVSAEIEGFVAAPIATVFDRLLTIDVTRILVGRGPLPAVVGVEAQTGEWTVAGRTRTLRLADGSSLHEALKIVDPPHHFAYHITRITGPLRHLVREMAGGWWLAEDGAARTHVRWRYDFTPRSPWTRPLSAAIVARLWRPYMESSFGLARTQIEDDRSRERPTAIGLSAEGVPQSPR